LNLLRAELANSFILIFGCDSFFITVSEPKKKKEFSIQEQKVIPVKVNANNKTHGA
jgi:hypothetical protein